MFVPLRPLAVGGTLSEELVGSENKAGKGQEEERKVTEEWKMRAAAKLRKEGKLKILTLVMSLQLG